MNTYLMYGIIFVILLGLELCYFKIADRFNIIDKPNERSSHSTIVLRGGGIIFAISMIVWVAASLICDEGLTIGDCYPYFLVALLLVAGVSFVDDIHSLPDSVRLVAQFAAMGLTLYQLYGIEGNFLADAPWWMLVPFVVLGLVIFVGASNIINFMDGINGITAGYSLAVLVPLALVNSAGDGYQEFIAPSLLNTVMLSVLVFCIFNFRPKGKAKCFAGDVGSLGIAFLLLFAIGSLVMKTGDVTWFIFLLVYGVDGVLTICHRIMLHENLGEAHRKHAYQLMCNELKIGHVKVSLLYMAMQLVVSLGFVCICPYVSVKLVNMGWLSPGSAFVCIHWIYLVSAFIVLAVAYVLFMKKYYHLHQEYLASL